MSNPILDMKAVVKHFPGKRALDGVDLCIEPGKVVGLLGRNGAGKTTLMECALGMRRIDAGHITLMGDTPPALSDATKSRIGYVPQQADLFEWLTPPQMLAFFKAFHTKWNDARVSALMDRWSIPAGTPIGQLSGGEKQRLAIARALAHDPDFLILDEPVASLDPAGRRDFLRELVERAVDRATTIIFSTHILSDLERIASDVAIMSAGKIILNQPLDTLTEQAYRIVGPTSLLKDMTFRGELSRRTGKDSHTQLLVRFDEDGASRIDALRGRGVMVESVALEDLFIEVSDVTEMSTEISTEKKSGVIA